MTEFLHIKTTKPNAYISVTNSRGYTTRLGFYAATLEEAMDHVPEYMTFKDGCSNFKLEWEKE
jgi:hypothetical protein